MHRGQDPCVDVALESVRRLRFDDGSPVRAASAVARYVDGWLVAQDDAAHAAWIHEASVEPLRLLPPVEGHDVFSAAAGTKHLKPDLEAACVVQVDGRDGVLLLGSGSTPARTRGVVVTPTRVAAGDLTPLYARVAVALDLAPEQLNLEGACLDGDVLRWFARGNLAAGVPSASVDVPWRELVAAVRAGDATGVAVGAPRCYDLGSIDGVGLAATDAVALPDGRVLLSAAAEDTPNAVDDGPVVAAALAVLEDHDVVAVVPLPQLDGRAAKVEGLALMDVTSTQVRLLAVVDEDDPDLPSAALVLRVRWA